MTRRNEDSGLIDLDALMREAAGRESSPAVPAPTSAPQAVRTEARIEAPVSAPAPVPSAPAAAASAPAAAASAPAAAPSAPASDKEGRPTVRPPAAIEREKRASAPPPSYKSGEAVEIVSIAKAAPSSRPANDVVPAAAPSAKAVPPAPSTMPSKLEPDSLEAVTTAPPSAEPKSEAKSASASASIPPVTERAAAGTKPSRRNTQIAIGAALALALLAGGAAFMRSRSTVAATTPVTTAAPTGAPSTFEKAPAAEPPPAEEEASAELSAEELPPAASASASASAARPTLARVGGVLPKPGPKPAENTGPAVLNEAELAGNGPSAAGDLGDAMRGAVGAREKTEAEKKEEEEAKNPNARQVRPSPGAVVGALGSVLPSARACLGPDEPVRSGLIVFKNDGTVARVDIKGTKPEDECVRAALSKAKVAPFVEETFSTRVTVRP